MKITASLAFLAVLTTSLVFLFSHQHATALENFKIRVWLANVKPDTGQVQLCVDVNTTFSSVCKKYDAGTLKIDYDVTEAPVVNAGTFNLTRTQAPLNSTFDVCVYVFKTDTGDCDDGIVTANLPKEEGQIQDLMVFTHISPIYYEKQDGRLYHFDHCYVSQSTDKNQIPPSPFCYKDEGVAVPNPDYPSK